MEISKNREDQIVAYLREYIEVCKKYQMYITGAIGADTALQDDKVCFINTFEGDLRSKIKEIIYGGWGGPGLYADDGNHIPPREQLDRISDRVWGVFLLGYSTLE